MTFKNITLAIAGLTLTAASTNAATIFLTNNTSPKTLASNEGDAGVGLTNGSVNNGLNGDKTGDSTVLTLSADDGEGDITFNTINVSGGKSLFMNGSTMGHGNEKWGNSQNWRFSIDQTVSFDGLDFQNNENPGTYILRSEAWKDDDADSGTDWSFSSDGTIGIFSLSSGQIYDFTVNSDNLATSFSDVAAGTEIGFGAFDGANGGDLLNSFTITPITEPTTTAAIPEPSTLLLNGLGAMLVLRRRRTA